MSSIWCVADAMGSLQPSVPSNEGQEHEREAFKKEEGPPTSVICDPISSIITAEDPMSLVNAQSILRGLGQCSDGQICGAFQHTNQFHALKTRQQPTCEYVAQLCNLGANFVAYLFTGAQRPETIDGNTAQSLGDPIKAEVKLSETIAEAVSGNDLYVTQVVIMGFPEFHAFTILHEEDRAVVVMSYVGEFSLQQWIRGERQKETHSEAFTYAGLGIVGLDVFLNKVEELRGASYAPEKWNAIFGKIPRQSAKRREMKMYVLTTPAATTQAVMGRYERALESVDAECPCANQLHYYFQGWESREKKAEGEASLVSPLADGGGSAALAKPH